MVTGTSNILSVSSFKISLFKMESFGPMYHGDS